MPYPGSGENGELIDLDYQMLQRSYLRRMQWHNKMLASHVALQVGEMLFGKPKKAQMTDGQSPQQVSKKEKVAPEVMLGMLGIVIEETPIDE